MLQRTFIESVVDRYWIEVESDILAFPSANLAFPKRDDESVCGKPDRMAVGSLSWLSDKSRPNITNGVSAVAHQTYDPVERHWRAVRKIITYPD